MSDLKTMRIDCDVSITAQAGEANGLHKFEMVANTGARMKVGFAHPVVLDLSTLRFSQNLPIYLNHDSDKIVGHSESVKVEGGKIIIKGVISGANEHADFVAKSASNKFPWQASVGVDETTLELVAKDNSVKVNGNMEAGPVYIARSGNMFESSFCGNGADKNTSARLAANKERVEMSDTNNEQPKVDAVKAEKERVERITAICGDDTEIAAKAINEEWDAQKTELAVMRAKRPTVKPSQDAGAWKTNPNILAAALCLSAGLSADFVAKKYGKDIVDQASHKEYQQEGLQSICYRAVQAAGLPTQMGKFNMSSVVESQRILAASSTYSLPGILGNSANTFLLAGYEGVNGVATKLCATRSVSDFKENTGYRMTTKGEISAIGTGGQYKHLTLVEEDYTNQADEYGAMITLPRKDIINDSLSSFAQIPTMLGRKSRIKLEKVFHTLVLDNTSSFYHTTGTPNYVTGATYALSATGLEKAQLTLRKQKDENGDPIFVRPKYLFVPVELDVTASQLMQATGLTGGSTAVLNTNVWANKFEVVSSELLSDTSFHASASTTGYYLMGDPSAGGSFTISYLNGQSNPFVETSDTEFDTAGFSYRVTFDFGVDYSDSRMSVFMKGAN